MMVLPRRRYDSQYVPFACLRLFFAASCLARGASSSGLFGEYLVKENQYKDGEQIPTWILPMTSFYTQLPLSYDTSLFCDAGTTDTTPPSRWIVGDDPIVASPLDIRNNHEDSSCTILCHKTLTEQSSSDLQHLIYNGYRQNLIIDNGLPAASLSLIETAWGRTIYHGGTPLGYRYGGHPSASNTNTDTSKEVPSDTYVFNHWNVYVDLEGTGRIVGFQIEPISIDHRWHYYQRAEDKESASSTEPFVLSSCPQARYIKSDDKKKPQKVEQNETIVYTYQVIVRTSIMFTPWSARWTYYLTEDFLVPDKVHWYFIMNSLFAVTSLIVMLIMVWIRRLRQAAKLMQPLLPIDNNKTDDDLYCWKKIGRSADAQKWRLLHGDVFRPPSFSPMNLAIACGTGAQLLFSTLFFCALCVLGIVTPIHKGTLFVGAVLSYTFVGSWVGGYFTSIVYQELQMKKSNDKTKHTAINGTAVLFPGVMFLFFLTMNEWARAMNSPMARPIYPDILLLPILWLSVFVPLTYRGAEVGFRSGISPFPVETSDEIRDIPKEQNLTRRYCIPLVTFLSSGVLVFGGFYVESVFLMHYFWYGQIFDTYGFMTIAIFLMVLCCAGVSILWTYWQLSRENHRWWWSSFGYGANVGVCFWLSYGTPFSRFAGRFDCPFDFADVELSFAAVLYYGVTLISSVGISMAFGFVSVMSSLYFNRAIYARMSASN
jgi:transmembrane 9 superfamily protein 2/4